jgi:hypothetical protein
MAFKITAGPSAMRPGSPVAAAGCMALFALPFGAAGLFMMYQSARQLRHGTGSSALAMGIAGMTFSGIAVAMILGGRGARSSFARLEARRAAAPGQPWLWRDDWASRRLQDTDRAQAGTLLVFALFWNLVSAPAAYFGVRQALQTGDKAPWVVLLFPAIGCVLLAAAIYAALRAGRYGRSVLELDAVPAPVGREIAGTIRVGRGLDPDHGVQLELTCLRRITTGSGKNRSTREEILWQDEQSIPGVSRQYNGVAIPVRMAIPADAEPCDDSDSLNRVLWRLKARATTPGVDYAATFEVPVFRTAESAEPPPSELVERHRTALAEYRMPADAPVRVTEAGQGVTVDFPMGRNPGAATGLTVFAAIWSGLLVALYRLDAPWFFRAAFGAFDVLLLAIAAALWLGRATIEAGGDGLRVTKGWGPFARTKSFRADEVARIETKLGMTAGSRAYFNLKVVFVDQSSIVAGSGLRDPRQAEWVAGRVMRALGKGDGGMGGNAK